MKKCSLSINGFELPVHLGWPDAERQQAQIVRINFMVEFSAPPKACETDQLEDTFCYDKLLSHLHSHIGSRQFKLIEHLAANIHTLIKPLLPSHTKLTLHLLKFPAINGLTGGVTFSYGD